MTTYALAHTDYTNPANYALQIPDDDRARPRPEDDLPLPLALEIYSRIALANAQDAYDQAIGHYPV